MAPQAPNKSLLRTALFVLAVALLVGGIGVDLTYHWTGYSRFTSPLTSTQIIERQKTIWDWLELLLIPLVLAAGGLWFSRVERRNEQKIAVQRAERELMLADENAQEAALQAYLEQMSTLLLDKGLRTSEEEDEVRDVARAWTLTVLRRVQGGRKGVVVRFLYESGLIMRAPTVISLADANLSGVYLVGANLSGADLHYADLSRANLSRAILDSAILSGANLHYALLEYAILRHADLRGARYSKDTRWPEDFDPDAEGAILVEEEDQDKPLE